MKFQRAHNLLPDKPTIDDVRWFLASHTAAVLLVDGTARARTYVLDRSTGFPVSPADEWMLQGSDCVLCVPDDSPGCLQLMVQPEVLNPRATSAFDRYLANHGQAQGLKFVRWNIESAKGGTQMFDGPAISADPVPLNIEGPLLKRLNQNPASLAAAVQKALEKVWADPRAVGLDWWGIDLATRFGATRVDFERKLTLDELDPAVAEFLSTA